MTNFDECAAGLASNRYDQWLYSWTGEIQHVPRNESSQISLEGCRDLCGAAPDYYTWDVVSGSILTWILPVIGILLQAPFESNAAINNLFLAARWLGSPMASIASTLWNIKVAGKSALMVDMANGYDDKFPSPAWQALHHLPLLLSTSPRTHFASMRDSMTILVNMNQYAMRMIASGPKEAENVLRIALFSKDLPLRWTPATKPRISSRVRDLDDVRHRLAEKLRKARRRGVVMVFTTNIWFIFSFAVSIESAFKELGDNATAHNLALGLLLGWIPVLVLCSIVDRNPTASKDTQRKLNKFINLVRDSLIDQDPNNRYFDTSAIAKGPKI